MTEWRLTTHQDVHRGPWAINSGAHIRGRTLAANGRNTWLGFGDSTRRPLRASESHRSSPTQALRCASRAYAGSFRAKPRGRPPKQEHRRLLPYSGRARLLDGSGMASSATNVRRRGSVSSIARRRCYVRDFRTASFKDRRKRIECAVRCSVDVLRKLDVSRASSGVGDETGKPCGPSRGGHHQKKNDAERCTASSPLRRALPRLRCARGWRRELW